MVGDADAQSQRDVEHVADPPGAVPPVLERRADDPEFAQAWAWFPFGTALGSFTLVILSRPEVKALFTAPRASAER